MVLHSFDFAHPFASILSSSLLFFVFVLHCPLSPLHRAMLTNAAQVLPQIRSTAPFFKYTGQRRGCADRARADTMLGCRYFLLSFWFIFGVSCWLALLVCGWGAGLWLWDLPEMRTTRRRDTSSRSTAGRGDGVNTARADSYLLAIASAPGVQRCRSGCRRWRIFSC
ncbi:hypothetical protein C8R45DRAFT_90526 [Mycena sanguinolenta]|nr:hypothetical protein C8R45DRAFT_90526 [Mycena sanguinolenta]